MKDTSTIGMSFLEKLIAVLFPIALGTIGWFLPKLLGVIKEISFFSDSKVIQLLGSFNPFWVSIVLMIVGVVMGVLLALTVFSEALKMTLSDQEIVISKDDHEKKISKSEVKAIFMEGHEVVMIGSKGQELLRERTEIQKENIQNLCLHHHYPWCEEDPYVDAFQLWTLDDHTHGEKVHSILYERRNALREKDKKKAKNLKMDLNELGLVVKDQGEEQYIRSTQK